MAKDGYAWWYVDVVSDDGETTLVLIAFLGAVFSPFYAAERRRRPTEPLEHAALHVALYRRGAALWSLTERPRAQVQQCGPDRLQLGQSSIAWEGGALVVRFRETTAPFWASLRAGAPIEGEVRLHPEVATPGPILLDTRGKHRWWPAAAAARAEVRLTAPSLSFHGRGYHDANEGDEPLERGLSSWHWQRAAGGPGEALVHYDVVERELRGGREPRTASLTPNGALQDVPVPPGVSRHVGISLRGGRIEALPPGPLVELPRSRWQLPRAARGPAVLQRTLEDTPFYARSRLVGAHEGRPLTWVHEALSLDRFDAAWVRFLLPFRMRRAP